MKRSLMASVALGLALALGSGSAAAQDFQVRWPLNETWSVIRGVGEGHNGIDIDGPTGTNVLAAASGWVMRSVTGNPDSDGGVCNQSFEDMGNHVVLLHGNGMATIYMHMGEASVGWGARVDCGMKIGTLGNTGCSSGSHLHFELHSGVSAFCSNGAQSVGGTVQDPYGGYFADGTQTVGMIASTSCPASFPPLPDSECGGWSPDDPNTVPWAPDNYDFAGEDPPDGTPVDPDSPPIQKTWTLRNTGSTTWDSSYELRYVGDDPACTNSGSVRLGGELAVPITGTVAPGSEVTLAVTLTPPEASGTFVGNWRLFNADGEAFGGCVWYSIDVAAQGPQPGCTPPSLVGQEIRDGDYFQSFNTGCDGTSSRCGWWRCSAGGWECGDVSNLAADRSTYAHPCCGDNPPETCSNDGIPANDPTPVVGATSSCISATLGGIAVEHGTCVQVAYAGCGQDEGCGFRQCVNGSWQCPQDLVACSALHENNSCTTSASCDGCDHGECELVPDAPPLPISASACTYAVCSALPQCCTTAWDEDCVREAETTSGACRGVCYDPLAENTCAHDECTASDEPLDAECSPCAKSVCAIDSYCCEKKWDWVCATISAKRDPYCSCKQ
jgi:murein DD-endopeptidase MepM/ murein hydrolase activator NlpD